MVKVFDPIPKVKGLNLMGGVVRDQQWYVLHILLSNSFSLGA